MKALTKNLDIFFVIFGGFLLFVAKDEFNSWRSVLLPAFGGAIIGAALAYRTIRSNK